MRKWEWALASIIMASLVPGWLTTETIDQVVSDLHARASVHRWDPKEIAKHLAFLVRRFTRTDFEIVLSRVNKNSNTAIIVLAQLQREKVLEYELASFYEAYFMDQSARVRYEKRLADQETVMQAQQETETYTLYDYLEMGMVVEWLRGLCISGQHAKGTHLADTACSVRYAQGNIAEGIESCMRGLERYELTNTLGAARLMEPLLQSLRESFALDGRHRDSRLDTNNANNLLGYVLGLSGVLKTEAGTMRMCVLDDSAVSDRIRRLPETLDQTPIQLEPHQIALWRDMIRCLESSAYRPAIVMGWGLVFDILRRWIIIDSGRLASFNGDLTSRYLDRNRKPVHEPVTNFEDFFEIGERRVLDVCQFTNLFDGRIHHDLVDKLNQRNRYAHANFHDATTSIAKGYIEQLIAIITDSHFTSP